MNFLCLFRLFYGIEIKRRTPGLINIHGKIQIFKSLLEFPISHGLSRFLRNNDMGIKRSQFLYSISKMSSTLWVCRIYKISSYYIVKFMQLKSCYVLFVSPIQLSYIKIYIINLSIFSYKRQLQFVTISCNHPMSQLR